MFPNGGRQINKFGGLSYLRWRGQALMKREMSEQVCQRVRQLFEAASVCLSKQGRERESLHSATNQGWEKQIVTGRCENHTSMGPN